MLPIPAIPTWLVLRQLMITAHANLVMQPHTDMCSLPQTVNKELV